MLPKTLIRTTATATSAKRRERGRSAQTVQATLRAFTLVLATGAALLAMNQTARAQTDVPKTWSLIPSGLSVGDEFRLLFVSSTIRKATATAIATYNTHVQNAAAGGHTDIQTYSSGFRVVGCTGSTNATTNTATTGTGVPIYWLNGSKVADNYGDFYDGSWDDEANPKNQAGNAESGDYQIFTGCMSNGTKDAQLYLGTTELSAVGLNDVATTGTLNDDDANPFDDSTGVQTGALERFYALSEVFQVAAVAPGKPSILGTVGTPTKITISWNPPVDTGGANISAYTIERAPDDSSNPGDPDDDNWATISTGAHASRRYTDDNLTPETTYHYRISATNSGGTGEPSGVSKQTTDAIPVVTVTATSATVTEGTGASFDISRTGDNSGDPITIHLATTKTGAIGVSAGNFTVSLAKNETTLQHSIDTENDALHEDDGSVTLTLRTASDGVTISGYTIGTPDTATVTVEDDDTVPGTPVVSALGWDNRLVLNWPKPADGTSAITGYNYRYKTTAGAASTWSAWTDTGLSGTDATNEFEITGLTNGTDYTAEVQANSAAGVSLAGFANATPTPAPMITSVAITSTPANASTYIIGEQIVVTVTFDKVITLGAGRFDPYVQLEIGRNVDDNEPECAIGTTDNKTLVCPETVAEGDLDTDGISVNPTVQIGEKPILGPLGQHANRSFSRLEDDDDHKVDGVKPTLSRADASSDLTKVVLSFSEALTETPAPATGDFTLNVDSGTAPTIDSVAIDGRDVTLSLSAAVDTSNTYTIDYTAGTNPIKDLAGNAAEDISGQSVSTVDTTAPTFVSANIPANNAHWIVLTYSETLDSTSIPAKSAFTVEVEGNDRAPAAVARDAAGTGILLTFDAAVRPGETVTVSYSKPGTNPIKDAADNEADSLAETMVTNNLAATAPEAPRSLAAGSYHISTAPVRVAADIFELSWIIPWHNGSSIEKHQYRYAVGSSVPAATTWVDIPNSAPGQPNDTDFNVTGLDADTEYTFEVRAVNGIDPGPEAAVTRMTPTPNWSFTLRDSSNNNVTELTEGGDAATATVSITNNVRFAAEQTVQIEWGGFDITAGYIQGAGGASTITIPAEGASGSLVISAPQGSGDFYQPSTTAVLEALHGGTQVGDGINLTFVDDEATPVATISSAPTAVNEGENIEIEITLTRAATVGQVINVTITDDDNALSGTLPSFVLVAAGDTSKTVELTTASNTIQNDGAHDVTFVLQLNAEYSYYTLGTDKSVTITVRDDDTPPLAPENLRAQAGDTEATLRWDAPPASNPDHGQPVLRYEYRVKVGTGSFGSWTTIPNSDADTRSQTFTGLTNDQEYTYEVAAVNVAGRGTEAQKSVTPIVGVAVSFAAGTLSVDEGDDATVTVTLALAPAVGETVTVPLTATPGTGLDSTEYSGVPMNVTFDAGDISKSFTVTAVDDTDDEPDRLLTFSFGTLPEGYVPGTHETLALTVADNDVPIVSASFGAAAASAAVAEGIPFDVTVSLSQAPEREVALPIVATRGANLAADEVDGVPSSLTFAADEASKSFTVTFTDDALEEGNETLTLAFGTLPDRVNSAGANPQLVLTVVDDDGPPAAPDVSVQTGDGYADLSWAPVANDSPVLRYEVRWRESDDGTFNAWLSVGLVTSYRVEGLTNGKAHEFQVRAVNAHGTDEDEIASAPGTPSQVITNIPTAVQGLWVRATDSSRAELSWWQPANATDEDHSSNPNSMMSQIQGYRIEVCRTTCDDETNWYALVPNTGKFEHRYTHQVLAPGVIRENRYRVRAININGKSGPWSNVAGLPATEVENVYLQTPDDSTLWVRFRVRNPDGNKLYVRYTNTGTGAMGHTDYRLTKKEDNVKLVLSGLAADTWYRVELDFSPDFDSERRTSWWYGTAKQGHTPLTSPYAKDLLDAQVFRGGQWREAPDNELYLRMGGTGKYRVRLKPCGSIYNVRSVRIQAPAGRLRASPTDTDPSLFTNLNCEVEQDGWRTDENGNRLTMGDVYDMTNFPAHANDHIPIYAGTPNNWHEVTVTARALEDYPADTRADALLSAPFAVVYNHAVWYGSHDTRSGPVSEGTGLVRISLDRPADAVLPEPSGVAIADPAGGSANPVMSWDAVDGAWGYLIEWRHGLRYSNRANRNRSLRAATSVTLPLGGSGRGPITARVRAYSGSGVSGWVERTWDSRAPTLNVLDTAVNEADGSVGFLVTLSPAASGTVTVDYTTVDGTAVEPADYEATSGTVTFAPGETRKSTALVPIVDDGEEDSGETFRLVLSSPTGSDAHNGAAVIADAEAVATILNSEREAASLTGFTLVDAGTNGDLMALAEGVTVRLGDLLASSYGIRAETSPGAAPGSVRLELSGAKTVARTDDAAPWSLYGDGAGRVNGGSLPPGSYTLSATAYADSGGRGEERGSLEVSFTVAAGALGVTTPGPFTVAEGETNVTTLAASDTGTGGTASWSIPAGTAGGADGAAFALTAEGVLSLVAAKDFEAPDDADGDGVYEVTVEVREGAQSATTALLVTLSDVDEAPLEVTTPGPFAVAEGTTAVAELAASDTGTGATATWSIPAGTAGGADGAAFALTPEGVLTLVAAKDFEAPDDADGDGTYEVTVAVAVPATVMAGAQSATAALLVTLTDANDAPVAVASAAPARVREGAEVTLDGSASTDPDADDTLSHAWTQDRDGAPRVVLSDASAAQPVFTSPSDLAAETELGFTLKVTDAAGLHSEAAVTVTVTLVSEVSLTAASGYAPEGADAVFRLTRAGSARAALTVPVTVEETGAMLGAVVPAGATFAAGVREASLRVPTAADAVSENDSRVTMRLGSGSGWQLAPGAASASLTVLDDDVAPVTSVSAAEVIIWSADMTVVEYGPRSIGAGTAEQFSNQMGRAGLRAKRLWYDPTERKLRIGFDDGLDDAELLTLHMGAKSVGFPANSGGDSSFTLENVDVSWTDGETLAVRVSKPSAVAVSTDATLASLSVDGATLSPAFDAGVLVYRAVADAETQTVTLAATANDGGASVAYGPAEDADTALADHQVSVPDEGETLVAVTVTAADGTVRRYRVVVARGASDTEPENTAPTGLPAISGTPKVGEALMASADDIADADGTDNATFAWQWLAHDGTVETAIAGATGESWTPTPAEAGKTLKVRVTFTDDKGNEETLVSEATDTVVDRRPVAATLSVGDGAAEAGRFRVRVAFGDAVTGLALADVTASRVAGDAAAVTELAQAETGRAWTAWVTAADAGRYTVRLAAGAAESGERRSLASVLAVDVDAAGNATAVAGPVVTAVALAQAGDGNWTAGDEVRLALTFSEPVTVVTDGGTPTVGVVLDGTARRAAYASGSGTGTLAVFSYTLTADDGTVSAVSVTTDSLALNGGTIRDAGGRDADLEHPGLGEAATDEVESTPAALTGLTLVDTGSGAETVLADGDALVLADPANGSYGLAASVSADADVGSVRLALTGAKTVTVTDDATPFSLYGDEDGTVTGAGLPAGSYTLSATAYRQAAGGGAELGTLAVSFTVVASAPVDPDALTASFTGVPASHGGPGADAFTFELAFSENPKLSYRTLRKWALWVTEGSLGFVRRLNAPSNMGWTVEVTPSGWDDVTVTLAGGGRLCVNTGAICTADGKTLENSPVATVPGPLALSVADARIDEGPGAVLAFEVTLNRAASGTVTVDYATADGTATAGADYTAASATLTFETGETVKTVNVTVLDDAHDDTGETLTLTLSNASGALLRDGEATGTIENSDPLPQAWLARFGRTVADQVVDAISDRLEGSSGGGSHVTLGGRRLALDGAGGAGPEAAARRGAGDGEAARQEAPSWEVSSWERGHLARMDTGGPAATRVHSRACGPGGQDARAPRDASRKTWLECNDAGASRSPGDDWVHARDGHGTRIMTGRELLLGSAFHLTLGGDANGSDGAGVAATRWTAWGGAAASGFDGEADGLIVDGDVTTFTFGADAARGRWLGGVALAHSTGEGGFRDHDDSGNPNHPGRGTGTLESTLTSVHPYLRFEASERLSLWGILGYGTGDLTLMVDAAGDTLRKTWKTDTSMWMTAAGARGVVLSAADHDGFELAARGEARLVGMNSEAVTGAATGADGAGPLSATESQTSRVRFLLEGSHGIELAGGQSLRPSLEVGLRHDGGDAETGAGIELGAGVRYAAPALGLTVEGKARGLLAHEDTDYREWGASGSVRIDPGAAGRGLSLTLTPAWGADSGGAERLWGLRDARGLATNDTFEPAGRLDAEAGYGLGAFAGRGLMTPFAGLALSDAGSRTWRSGVRWTLGPDLSFGVEGALREAANDNPAEHDVGFKLRARF